MKNIKFCLAIAALLVLTSCSYQVYPTQTLADNYNVRMNTAEELDVKSKVKIFLNEKDIQSGYEVISYVKYTPLTLPIIMSAEKVISKKFYEKAVLKAYELGGNAIIVTDGGAYKVVYLTDWENEKDIFSKEVEVVNVIFNRTLLDMFNNGEVAKLTKGSDVRKLIAAFKAEIESNTQLAVELNEVEFIKEKISALEAYNTSLDKPKNSIMKDAMKLRKKLGSVEKKINRKLKWNATKEKIANKKAQAQNKPQE